MKILKKITAAILVCIMALSFTACHKKGEIAVTVNDYEFTSAYYMCAFLNAYMEAQQLVYNELTEEEMSAEKIDYSSHKVEDKPFDEWVKDTAISTLKEHAHYKSLCKEKGFELSEEEKSTNEYYASMYWESYGYSEMFEPNGVSQQTYTAYMTDSAYSTLYFEKLYGKDGEEEIPAETVESKLYSDFLIADILDFTANEETAETELKDISKKFEDYAKQLEDKKVTFEEVYNEYNNVEETEETEEDHEGHDHAEPKDALATVMGAEGTGYEHDYYDEIKKMKTGEIKVIEKKDNAGYLLVVKQDIKADTYYLESMDMTVRHLLKDEEFNKKMTEEAEKLTADINKYAVNQFKVKKIVEPSYQ